ncbi:MAG: hypothetical protein LUG18_06395 [Candidatus Azobacteroides sp.]|nr:hypothetical protein [Candidatus Azobacteroides sp.]
MLFILIIIFINFFDFHPLLDVFSKIKLVITLPLFLYCFNTIFTYKGTFSLPVKLIIFSILFSAVTAKFAWSQPFSASFREIPHYLGYLLYFFLIKKDTSIRKVEKVMLTFTTLYVVLYLYQFVTHENIVFGVWENADVVRGIIRIIFSGEGFLFFGIAYFFHKILRKENTRLSFIFLVILLVIMFMQVTRQYILAVGIMILLGLLRKSKLYMKILAVLFVFIAANIYQYSTNPLIEGIRESQSQNMEEKEDYIRIIAANYFLFEMAPNKLATVFGNGIPNHQTSYGREYYGNLTEEEGFYFVDLGLIGGYSLFGILFVIGYIIIGYRTFKYPPGDSGEYLRYYILMIFVMSLTSASVLGHGFVVPTAIVLYLYEKYRTHFLEEQALIEEEEEEFAEIEKT